MLETAGVLNDKNLLGSLLDLNLWDLTEVVY